MKLVAGFPDDFDKEDMQEVLQACQKMPGAPKDAFEQLVGNWRVEWSSLGGRAFPQGGKLPPARPLQLQAFGALPAVPVCFLGSYNRVLAGGAYELIQAFTVPGAEGVEAAMVLAGPWTTGSSDGEWGRGAPRMRCGVTFETVRLVLSASNPEASKAMLKAAGLADYQAPVSLAVKGTYIDLQSISEKWRVHKGESGMVYVLTRTQDAAPFLLG